MKFKNALNGISKIFTAEILDLIATFVIGITSIFLLVPDKNVALLSAGTLASIAGILMIIGAILNLVGIIQASKDERSFKAVIYLMILGVVLAIVSGFFNNIPKVSEISQAAGQIIEVLVSLMVILGFGNIAKQLGNTKIENKAQTLFKIIIVINIIIIAARVALVYKNDLANVVAIVLMIVALVLGVVQYIMYLSFLSKTKKMLQENVGEQ